MKFPFVTRTHHEEVVTLLRAQIAGIESERELYLDRLATAGLGGAFFHQPVTVQPTTEESTADAELTDEDRLRAYRRRPSHMSAFVTRQFRKRFERKAEEDGRALHIRKDVEDELDAAEEAGRRQSA